MITKKFYQKNLLVLFYYPPELVLEQYMNMSNFLIFGIFQMLFKYQSRTNGPINAHLTIAQV